MKKIARKVWYSVGATLLILLLLAPIYPSLFLTIITPVYKVISFSAKQVGYEFRCYGLHGGFDCGFIKPLPTDDEVKQQDDALMGSLRCQNDSDCVLTAVGACAVRGIESGTPSDGACVCANGPVISGCFPKDSPALESLTP
jgi:hypothetical protein